MKYLTKSRKFLEENCRIYEEEGKFYRRTERVGVKEINKWTQATHHKYGKTLVYEYVCFYDYVNHKPILMTYHAFIYAWYKGEIPRGYDVDHIDNDTLNNDLDNLQLLTRGDNIRKRGKGKNQYSFIKRGGDES